MKNMLFRICSLFCMAAVLSPFLHPVCEASTAGKPIVIRKKITAPTQKTPGNAGRSSTVYNQKSRRPEPKSDISITSNDSADKKIAGAHTATARLRPLYNPAGKTDPFEPLIKETPKIQTESETYADTDHKGPTALEKIDLSQLKLTGVMLAASGNKALVREASGRGHVISEGTPIGIHRGRVAGVLQDKVIVKEKMKDLRGRFFFKETELKLNKPNV
jgi:type IV pilus assembly protein PilP